MAAFGQTFDSNTWLRNSRIQQFYQRIDVGGPNAVGQTFWVPWWLQPWVFVLPSSFQKAQLIRTTWLAGSLGGYPRSWPLVQRTAADQGQVVWNNWFFNTPYTPSQKLATLLSAGIYTYVGQAALLGALRTFSIVGAGSTYSYAGADSRSDFAMSPEALPYAEFGGDLLRPYILAPSAGIYSYQGFSTSLVHISVVKGFIMTTSTRTVLGPKRVTDVVGPPFDFSGMVQPSDAISAPSVTVNVWSGVDPNPSAVYTGSSLISGNVVYPTLQGGVPGVLYEILVSVNASHSGILSQGAFLSVLPNHL